MHKRTLFQLCSVLVLIGCHKIPTVAIDEKAIPVNRWLPHQYHDQVKESVAALFPEATIIRDARYVYHEGDALSVFIYENEGEYFSDSCLVLKKEARTMTCGSASLEAIEAVLWEKYGAIYDRAKEEPSK